MVQYGDSTVYFSRIGDRHLWYPGNLRIQALPWISVGMSPWSPGMVKDTNRFWQYTASTTFPTV